MKLPCFRETGQTLHKLKMVRKKKERKQKKRINFYSSDFSKSKLFGNIPDDVYQALLKKNVTENFHQYGLSPEVGYFIIQLRHIKTQTPI